jgi:uncharacterized membrane protein YozB (DUF420 family)
LLAHSTDMRFQGQGAIRYFYFPLLISHIGLSVVALPMILISFFLSLSNAIDENDPGLVRAEIRPKRYYILRCAG